MSNIENFFKKLAYDLEWNYDDPDVNTDHPTCPECGNTMNFHGQDSSGRDYSQGDAYWECDSCGFKFDENQVRQYDPEDVWDTPDD